MKKTLLTILLLMTFAVPIFSEEMERSWFSHPLDGAVAKITATLFIGGTARIWIILNRSTIEVTSLLFEKVNAYIYKNWDVTTASGRFAQVGVGEGMANPINKLGTFFYSLAGMLIYVFFVIGLITNGFYNQDPFKLFYGIGAAVLILILYGTIYTSILEFTTILAGEVNHINPDALDLRKQIMDISISIAGNENKDMIKTIMESPIAELMKPNPADEFDISKYLIMYKFWIVLILQILIAIFISVLTIGLIAIKAMQQVSLAVAYFIGFIPIAMIVIDGGESFKKWLKGFIAVAFYAPVWAIILIVIKTFQKAQFEGFTEKQAATNGFLLLACVLGGFILMKKVNELTDSFSLNKQLIAGASQEFGRTMKAAGTLSSMAVGGAALTAGVNAAAVMGGGGGFVSGFFGGFNPAAAKMPEAGGKQSSGKYKGKDTGGKNESHIHTGIRPVDSAIRFAGTTNNAMKGAFVRTAGMGYSAGQSVKEGLNRAAKLVNNFDAKMRA